MAFRFKGGAHPKGEKESTRDMAVRDFPAPATLVVPLQQHLGAPAEPRVAVGDRVLRGQEIGKPAGFVSAAVHSPVSGAVSGIEKRYVAGGGKALSVIITNDGKDEAAPGVNVETDTTGLSAEEIRGRVRAAGVVGMGGATFPTDVKLSPPENKPIDTLIVNGAECEPFLTADYRLMLEEPDAIVAGAELARRASKAARIVFAIEDNKPEAYEALMAAAAGTPAEVVMLRTRYPQGGEKQLIQAITGREVPSGGLPMDVSILVQNVATCAAIYNAVRFGRPLIERIVTVSGPAAKAPGNFRVRVGTLLSEVIAAVGVEGELKRVVMGGPMMGIAQARTEVPVTKGTSGILLLNEIPKADSRACIRCGKCVRACPIRMMPSEIGVFLEAGKVDDAAALDLFDCIECGCCAYVCPSNRPLLHWIKAAKAEVRARREREKKGAAAK